MILVAKEFLHCPNPTKGSLLYLFVIHLSNNVVYYSSPTKDYLLFLSRRIPSLFQSDKWFFVIHTTNGSIIIRILCYSSLGGLLYYSSPTYDSLLCISKGFLYDPSPTKNSVLLLSRRISLSFQSDRGFFTTPLSESILYYSNPAKDSLLFLTQRISSAFHFDKGFCIIPLSKDFFIIPIRQKILYYSSLKGILYYSSPTHDSLSFLSQSNSLLFSCLDLACLGFSCLDSSGLDLSCVDLSCVDLSCLDLLP